MRDKSESISIECLRISIIVFIAIVWSFPLCTGTSKDIEEEEQEEIEALENELIEMPTVVQDGYNSDHVEDVLETERKDKIQI